MSRFSIFVNNMKLMEFPELRQAYDYDCGASVLQSILFYYGEEYRESDIIEDLKVDPDIGAEPADIIRVARKYGLRPLEKENISIDELKSFVDSGVPVMIMVQAWPDTPVDWNEEWDWAHWVAVIGYDDKRIYFEDPASSKRTYLTYDELDARWHAYIDQENKSWHYGIIMYGRQTEYRHTNMEHMD
jgi:ABC-type bacteriocin/lantibiotic exporter with double-glycine peptidase domain